MTIYNRTIQDMTIRAMGMASSDGKRVGYVEMQVRNGALDVGTLAVRVKQTGPTIRTHWYHDGCLVQKKVAVRIMRQHEAFNANQSAPADKGGDDWHMNPCKQGHRDVGAAGGVAHCYTCDEKIEAATTQEAYERWNAAHPAEQPESADKGQGSPVARITLQQVLKAYDYAESHPHKYLRGTTNWCAAVAHSLNAAQPASVAVDDCDLKALMDRHEAWKAGEANGIASMVMPDFDTWYVKNRGVIGTAIYKNERKVWNACLDEFARLNSEPKP